MKNIFLPTLFLVAIIPAAVHAEEPTAQRFEHDGSIYSYTVTRVGEARVITGVEEKTGKRFKLRVGEHRVRGTVGSQEMSFPLRAVQPLGKIATTLAAR